MSDTPKLPVLVKGSKTPKPRKSRTVIKPDAPITVPVQVDNPETKPTKSPLLLTDMKRFYFSVDWGEWWEEFYLTHSSNGLPKYRTVRQFANAKAENELQKDFIIFCCGKRDLRDALHAQFAEKYKWVEGWDWDTRRSTGGWFVDSKLSEITKPIRAQMEALSAMREVGDRFIVKQIARLEKLMEQLDTEFGGRFFVQSDIELEDLPTGSTRSMLYEMQAAAADRRAKLYVQLSGQILALMERTQSMYAKSHGINTDTESFSGIVAAAAVLSAARDNPKSTESKGNRIIDHVASLLLEKSATYDIPLPKDVEEAAINALNVTPGSKKAN